MKIFTNAFKKIQEFYQKSRELDGLYSESVTRRNSNSIIAAAGLIMVIELFMITRLYIDHPAIDTPASRIYLALYVSLFLCAATYLLIKRFFSGSTKKLYWLQFSFVALFLIWFMILNSYDLARNQHGSSLALISSILFASVLVHFRPQHLAVLQGVVYSAFYYINYSKIEDKINSNIAIIVTIFVCFYFYIRDIYSVYDKQCLMSAHAHIEKDQLESAKNYLKSLQQAQTQNAIYHHDLRHTLNLMEQLALQGDIEKLQSFVLESNETLNNSNPSFFCMHETLNLVLGGFSQQAKAKNIDFKTDIRLGKDLSINDTDLCALLSNLLENAINACEKVSNISLRYILVKSLIRDNKFMVTVENSFDGRVKIKNGRPLSLNRGEYHGFGTQSIINITKKHQGFYSFSAEDKVFHAQILLSME